MVFMRCGCEDWHLDVRNDVEVQVGGEMLANGILERTSEPYIVMTEDTGSEKTQKLLSAKVRTGRMAEKPRRRSEKGGFHLDSLIDAQHRSLSLNALARSAALSGKRLIIEIRDQHPVKIIRHENS
jgi:hypothetical protein